MKKRIYTINNKILVKGNENELTKDEVLVKEENGSVVLKERVNGKVVNIVTKEDIVTTLEMSSELIESGCAIFSSELDNFDFHATKVIIDTTSFGLESISGIVELIQMDSRADGDVSIKNYCGCKYNTDAGVYVSVSLAVLEEAGSFYAYLAFTEMGE